MRKFWLLLGTVASISIVVALARPGWHRADYTTSSAEAYRLYQQGEDHLNSFQFPEAVADLAAALELDPDFAMAHAAMAEALVVAGQDKARKRHAALADSLARLLPKESERLLVQLRCCQTMRLSTTCLDSLLALLVPMLPNHPQVLVAQAMVAQRDQDEAAEQAVWRKLLQADPNYARGWNWLGYAAANKGRYEEALSYLQRYAFVAPDIANPHDSLGEVLLYMGRYEEAEQELRRALEIQPDFFFSLLNLARVYAQQGRVRKAVEIVEQTRLPFVGTSLVERFDGLLIDIYRVNEMWDATLEAMRCFVASAADGDVTPYLRAILLAHGGRGVEALALIDSTGTAQLAHTDRYGDERALRYLNARVRSFQAHVYKISGEPTRALEGWGRALAEMHREPPHQRWWYQLRYAEALLGVGQPEPALVQLDEILACNPRLIHPLVLRTRALLALDRLDEARQALGHLETALAQADSDLPAVAELAALRRQLAARGAA